MNTSISLIEQLEANKGQGDTKEYRRAVDDCISIIRNHKPEPASLKKCIEQLKALKSHYSCSSISLKTGEITNIDAVDRNEIIEIIRNHKPASCLIFLSQGKFALVDEKYFGWLNRYKWNLDTFGYARRSLPSGDSKLRPHITMHRMIMDTPDDMETDHINGDKLDNRECNLRICTKGENKRNVGKQNGSYSSKYKGVTWHKKNKKWQATISVNKKSYWLGQFDSEADAAKAYNVKAMELHGKFANLNVLEAAGVAYVE